MLTRRHFLALSAASATLAIAPSSCLAAGPTDPRFMFVFLRGGMDGLAAVPTPEDPSYQLLRPNLAESANDTLNLDDVFALHPGLPGLHALYDAGESIVFHAIASANRERSHFEAMRHLEQGGDTLDSIDTGWLARATSALYPDTESAAVALSQALPVSFLGGDNVLTWAPSRIPAAPNGFLDQLNTLYRANPDLIKALADGRAADAIAATPAPEDMSGNGNTMDDSMAAVQSGSPQDLARSAGQFLALDDGPRIAMLDIGGWDTHDNQRVDLNRQLPILDDSLQLFRTSIGDAWQHTAIFVMSEFGRTVAENGTAGTDHGTAGAAFLLGGAIRGGRVIADWLGLDNDVLLDGRDLPPTTDARSIMKSILIDHLGLAQSVAEQEIFPNSSHAPKMSGLFL